MSRTYCAEVLSLAPTPGPRDRADSGTGPREPRVKVLLIVETVEGFVIERFTDRGGHVADTQHDTPDEAMHHAYSEYDAISDWRLCPDGADPLEYIHATTDRELQAHDRTNQL